ncbi:MAG: fibronectin type III domain-containing protein, partial [Propionibacteriaceae bacterium]|nr:fibronectin type III domain-containing protein [Propionibacteriaceae bacterium]
SFQAPLDYTGPAAVILEVTDGETLEDSTGLKNVISIPVTVVPRDVEEKKYSVHIQDAAIEVEAGQSATLNLAGLVTGVEPSAGLTYSIVEETRAVGVDISLRGSTLTASSNIDVTKSTTAKVTVKVAISNYSDEGRITVTIVGSKKPLAVAVSDYVADANRAQQVCVNVLANDTNPFPGKPLVVVDALVESGRGSVSLGCANSGVGVTPASSFVGEMVVRYTIQDATEDRDRQVQGRIFLTVRGEPDPPTGLHIDQVGDKSVVLSWLPPNNNGSPITGYTVTSNNGYVKQCPATTCSLDGLKNDTVYQFQVTATNEVGTSKPSAWSDEARPDIVPFRLDAPTIEFGDKSVKLSWVSKGSAGSQVTSYDLWIEPAPSSGKAVINTTGTSLVWDGLANGTEYRVRVCARNAAQGVCEDDSHWSPLSRGEIPAGVPDAPAAPTWTRLNAVGSERQVRVCWNTPNQNGDAISSYTLKSSNGTVYPDIAATGSTTCSITTLPTSTTAYTFTVAGTNKAGQGGFSPASSGFRAVNPPGPVSGLTSADRDASCQISFSAAALNGASASEVTYHWRASNGATGGFGSTTSGLVTGLPNNSTYTISVWATTTVQSDAQDGPETSIGTCRPFGLPAAPEITVPAKSNSAVYSWAAPSPNGRAISSVQVNVDGKGWTTVELSGSSTLGNGCDRSYNVEMRAIDSEGQMSAVRTVTVATVLCYDPSVTVTLSNQKCNDDPDYWCWLMQIRTRDFRGQVRCWVDFTTEGINQDWWWWEQGPNSVYIPGPGVNHGTTVEVLCEDSGNKNVVTSSGRVKMP